MKFVRLLNDEGELYHSYRDFWRLVELSGFETVEQNAIDLSAAEDFCCFILNGNVREWAKRTDRRCRFIGWQLERVGAHGYDDFAPATFDRVWVSDKHQAAALADRPHVQYVPIGGHPELGGRATDKRYDFAVMAYLYGRRAAIVNGLLQSGYTVAPSCWGVERDAALAASRMGLCLHQHDNDRALEPLRATLFACWRLPLVYEACDDYSPYGVYSLSEVEPARQDAWGHAERNYEMMTGPMTFRRCVEAAL